MASPSPNPNPNPKTPSEKEGHLLLGLPTFTPLPNNRLRCVESNHELPAADKDRYSLSKACRLSLIDAFVSAKKPPLNIFNQCPLSKSKLVCKLTGDTINKTEEHIWKHLNGRRFSKRLDMKEKEKSGVVEESGEGKKKKKEKKAVVVEEEEEMDYEEVSDDFIGREMAELGIGFDDESPVEESDGEGAGLGVANKDDAVSAEVSKRRQQASAAVGPNSSASKKKKSKKSHPRVADKEDAEPMEVPKLKHASAAEVPNTSASKKKKSKKSHPRVTENDDAELEGGPIQKKRTSAAVGPSSFAARKKKTKKSQPSTAPDN